MYEGLRLTELHEEVSWNSFQASEAVRKDDPDLYRHHHSTASHYDAEIRARVAAQEIGPPWLKVRDRGFTGLFSMREDRWEQAPLAFGIPDAERVYPAKRRTYATNGVDPLQGWPVEHYPAHWTNHKTHTVPVEGCHLCREGRR